MRFYQILSDSIRFASILPGSIEGSRTYTALLGLSVKSSLYGALAAALPYMDTYTALWALPYKGVR